MGVQQPAGCVLLLLIIASWSTASPVKLLAAHPKWTAEYRGFPDETTNSNLETLTTTVTRKSGKLTVSLDSDDGATSLVCIEKRMNQSCDFTFGDYDSSFHVVAGPPTIAEIGEVMYGTQPHLSSTAAVEQLQVDYSAYLMVIFYQGERRVVLSVQETSRVTTPVEDGFSLGPRCWYQRWLPPIGIVASIYALLCLCRKFCSRS